MGPSSALIAFSMGFSQIALYAFARQGQFYRIWIMKGIQVAGLLFFTLIIYQLELDNLYWLAFFGSYLCPGLTLLKSISPATLLSFSIRNDVRRLSYSFRIATMSLGSLLSGSFTRELPVLISGAIGQTESAGTLGLVMRIIGAPIALLARSASAVVGNYVASARFDTKAMRRLSIIPLIGMAYILVLFIVSNYLSVFQKYEQFSLFLVALSPFFLFRAYIGLLGSAIVYFKLQGVDLVCNLVLAIFSSAAGIMVYYGALDISSFLWVNSILSIGFSIYLGKLLMLRLNKL